MGNKNSRSKHERSLIKNIQEFNQIESDQERHEKFLGYYFSTSTDSIDRVTKPGGYIEVADRRNENVERAPILRKLMDTINESGLKRNVDINLIYSLESKFELHPNIGNVHQIEKKIIVGLNSDKIGLVSRELALAFLKSEPILIKFLSEELGVSEEEYKKLIEKDLVEEFEQVYSESIYVRIWAQKQLT
ncbi:6726_t:CDS:2 [Rhizophagus irregularis]|nr:6726_t:CDS:2 [Rhizophagus irregularis]